MPLGIARHNSLSRSVISGPTFVPNADSFAQYLALALPLNSVTQYNDVSHLVSGSPNSSACFVRSPQSATSGEIVTNNYKFYNSSHNSKTGGGSEYKIYADLQTSWNPYTTNYTIEFWINTTRTNNNSWFISNADVGGRYLLGIYVTGNLPTNISMTDYRMINGTGWHHIAIQRDYWYYDGIRRGTVVEPNLSTPISRLHIGQQIDGDANDWEGYLNDFRLYIGVNKYSGTTITPPGAMGVIV